jgi:hypothetical protein
VGKSAIVQMFHSKGTHYPKQYVMTTGCNFVMKELKVRNPPPPHKLIFFMGTDRVVCAVGTVPGRGVEHYSRAAHL